MKHSRIIAVVVLGGCVAIQDEASASTPSTPDELELRKAENIRLRYEHLFMEGKFEAAIEAATRACSILKRVLGERSAEYVSCTNNLGVFYTMQGNFDMAERLLSEVLQFRRLTLGNRHPDVAMSLNNLAGVYIEKGNFERAGPLLTEARSIFESVHGPEHVLVANVINNLGRVRLELGEPDDAIALFQHALRIREKELGADHPASNEIVECIAGVYHVQGRFDQAEALYKKVLLAAEGEQMRGHRAVVRSLNNLATLYMDMGAYGKAEMMYMRALDLLKEAEVEGPDYAKALANLGELYRVRGEYTKAETLLRQALHAFDELHGSGSLSASVALNNLGLLHSGTRRYEEAETFYRRSLAIKESFLGPDHWSVAIVLDHLAVALCNQRKFRLAEPLQVRALAIRENVLGSRHPLIAQSLVSLVHIYFELGDLEAALESSRRILDIEEAALMQTLAVAEDSRRVAFASVLFERTHAVLSLHLQNAPDDGQFAELALTALLRRKARVQSLAAQSYSALRRSLPQGHRQILDDLSELSSRYAALTHRLPTKNASESYRASLVAIEREQEALWDKVRRLGPRAQAFAESISVRDIQVQIPGNAALIEYVKHRVVVAADSFKGQSMRYAACVVFSDRIDWIDLGPVAAIDEKVRLFREAIVRGIDVRASSHALHDSIVKPIVDRLGVIDHLFIAPDGNLNVVPFDALVDGDDDYLVERFHLHYLTSGRDLLRPWMLESPADGPVVVVANPAGADLPGTEHEAMLLASLFGEAVTIQHEHATETQLRIHERPRILHLATHGTFGAGRPGHTLFDAPDDLFRSGTYVFDGLPPTQLDNPMLYSWLDLATPPVTLDDPTAAGPLYVDDTALLDDGKLTAYEVSGWDLRGTELVTLSACDTAQGTYEQGEGILGLRRAFAIAGAQTQVMSLWKVSDTATAKLMESYYRRLLAGEGRSEAMRNTQLEMLRNPETRHPRDWAAFVVVGEWGPLSSINPPTTTDPEPISPRPRGCQARIGTPTDHPSTILILLPFLAFTRHRRASMHH